jgi:hypothetical protein
LVSETITLGPIARLSQDPLIEVEKSASVLTLACLLRELEADTGILRDGVMPIGRELDELDELLEELEELGDGRGARALTSSI